MHAPELIITLASALTAALIFGYATQRFGLSPLVGYLIAGVAVGPSTPGFIANQELAEQFAEVGVVLLMFGVGLQFHLDELLRVRRVALPGAIAGMLAATVLGTMVGLAAGYSRASAIVFGLTLCISSTVVLVRMMSDSNQLHTSSGHIAIGWLVVEDVLAVIVLVLLPTVAGGRLSASGFFAAIALTVLKVLGLIVVAAIGGTYVVPRLLDAVARTRSRELFTLTVLAMALGLAVVAAKLFGVSMALGAFVAGMAVGRSEYSLRAATDALPMRDAFAVVFFVSVGMLFRPLDLLETPGLLLGALAVVVIGKPLLAAVVVAVLRYPLRIVLAVPAALAQIGEFSFMLAAVGRDLEVLPARALNVVVAVSILSIIINPIGGRVIARLERWLFSHSRLLPSARRFDIAADDGAATSSSIEPSDRAVVIGYGPTGRTVTRLLRDAGISPTVVDLNMDTIRRLQDEGVSALHGDARSPSILIGAGLRHADTLIVSGADDGVGAIIREARELNPQVRVFARAAYLRDVPPLVHAGASQVFSGEGEVALAMTEAVMQHLGATADQVDRARVRVREELFGSTPATFGRRALTDASAPPAQ